MVTGVVAVGCTTPETSTPESTVAPTTTEAPTPREIDDVLRIGALLPGGDTFVGASLESSVLDAEEAINEAGGVFGTDIVVTVRDEGTTTATASAAIASLLGDGVDAIIGPSSSLTTLGALDDAVAAEVVTCSPTATAIALDDFPDDRLFFRTIASDSLQAAALAEVAEDTGERDVAIVYLDDAYGRPYAEAVTEELRSLDLDVVASVPVAVGDDNVTDDIDLVVGSGARVAIVVGAPADAARFLDAIGRSDSRALTDVIVNDSVRDAVVRPVIVTLPTSLRTIITGVAPQITVRDEDGVSGPPFEPQVTDCMNLIALAAMEAEYDLPKLIAQQMPSISSGGSVCTSFAECADELGQNQQIDYRGPTGVTELNREGETAQARFETFEFDDTGVDTVIGTRTVGG